MATTVTPLSDGGRVETTWSGGKVTLQKYDAGGAAVGDAFTTQESYNVEPKVVALSDGGYAMMAGFVFKGGYYAAYVFDADATSEAVFRVPPGSGIGADIVASPDGGFLVVAMEYHYRGSGGSAGVDYSWRPHLTMYDNSGAVVRGPVALSGDLPHISVLADGSYQVDWQDGNISHSITIDPDNPPAFDKPATPEFVMIDDEGERTGVIEGWATADITPVIRVTVTDTGWVEASRELNSPGVENNLEGGIRVTEADVARGYIDIPAPQPPPAEGAPYIFFVRFKDDLGVVSESSSKGLNMFNAVDIWSATDDVGTQTGLIADGGTTDDSTPTLRIGLEDSGKAAGDVITITDGSQTVGEVTLTADDVARGYVDVTTSFLPNGDHALRAWNVPIPAYQLTVAASGADPTDDQAVLKAYDGTPTEGGQLSILAGQEGLLPGGSFAGVRSTTTTDHFFISAPDGVKALTVDGHTVIADGTFTPASWDAFGLGKLAVTAYDAATGEVSVSYTIERPMQHAADARDFTFQADVSLTDADGDQASGQIKVIIYDDTPRAVEDVAHAGLGGGAVTGNLFANDGSADGVFLKAVEGVIGDGPITIDGAHGVLTVQANGDYSYTPDAGGTAGDDIFDYAVRDGEGDWDSSRLTVTVDAGSSSSPTSVTTTDGGHVDWWVVPDATYDFRGTLHAQKYDAAGQKVGAEYTVDMNPTASHAVYPLDNGGYVVAATQNGMDGLTLIGGVFRADASQAAPLFGGVDWHLETSPDGGFLVGSINGAHHAFTVQDARLQLYDDSGQLVTSANISASAGPQITVDADGVFHASWNDRGGNAHTLAIDPDQPPTFTAPSAPSSVGWVDDVGGRTGVIIGSGTDDATPAIRVPVTQAGWLAVEVAYSGAFGEHAPTNPSRFVEVTAEDVARGYKEIVYTSPFSDNNYTLAARFENADGIVGPENWTPIRVDTKVPTAPTVTTAVDNQGAQTGDVASGGSTDDTTPTIFISIAGTGAQTLDKMLVFDNGQQINFFQFQTADLQQGQVSFTPTLAAGSHSITAYVQDLAGNVSPVSGAFQFTVTADGTSGGGSGGQVINSPGPGSTLTGGAGDDTLNASRGPDVLTGGGGADKFAWADMPWSAAKITDFTMGADRLDLSGVFADIGYTGSDPVADGYVKLITGGGGNTWLYIDTDGRGSADQWGTFAIDLAGVSDGRSYQTSTITWAQLSGGGSGGNPPPPPGPSQIAFQAAIVTHPEGNTGATAYSWTVVRSGDLGGTSSVEWTVSGVGFSPASGNDFVGGAFPTGVLTFNPGESSKTLTVSVAGDTIQETDERFGVTLSGATGATVGAADYSEGAITNDDAPPSGGSGGPGQTLQARDGGSTLVGGSGDDTLIAAHGPDVLSGAGGADVFRFPDMPWQPARITDFVAGTDRLDLSGIFSDIGYTGSDPVADGYVKLLDAHDGRSTYVYIDTDGRGTADQWGTYAMLLESVRGLTWADLSGGSAPPPPPASELALTSGDQAQPEGGSTTTAIYQFTVTRTGDTTGTATANWNVAGSGSNPASADDFVGGALPSGTVSFAAGETSKVIEVRVQGDTTSEPNEDFTLTLSGAAGASLGQASVHGTIVNDDNATGQVYVSDQYGDTLVGGDGHDTLIAGRGPDQLTGGAGQDHFVWNDLPWNAGHVTDFHVGVDKLDLSALFGAAGYSGSDPIADHRLEFRSDGQGNTQVYFDRDDPNAGDWPYLITTLDGVSPSQISASDWLF